MNARYGLFFAAALGLAAAASAQPSLLGVGSQTAPGGSGAASSRHVEEKYGFKLILESTPAGADVRLEAPSARAADVQQVAYIRGTGRVATGTGYRQLPLGDLPHALGAGPGWRAAVPGKPGDPIEARVRVRRIPYAWESWPIVGMLSPGSTTEVVLTASIPGTRVVPVIRGLDFAFVFEPLGPAAGVPERDPEYRRITPYGFRFHARLTGDPAMLARVRAVTVHHKHWAEEKGWQQFVRFTDPSAGFSGEMRGAPWSAHLGVRDERGQRWSAHFDPRDAGQSPLRVDIELEKMEPVRGYLLAVPPPAGAPVAD